MVRCVNAHNGTCEATDCSHYQLHEAYVNNNIDEDEGCAGKEYCCEYDDIVWCE